MPRIPLYSFQPQATQSQNVRADTGMFNQQAQAAQRLGNAVAGLGEVAADTAFKLQRAQNYKSSTVLQMGMEEEWDQFQNTLNPSTDESKWTEEWQKKLDARVAKLAPKDAGPVLRQQIELQTQQFKVRTTGDIGQQAKAVGVEKAKVAGLTRTDQLFRNGDAGGAEANLSAMADLGLILPEEIPAMVQKGTMRMEQQAATNLIANDPIMANDVLQEKTEGGKWKNFTNLDEDDRLTLLNHARAQTTALQSATYQELIDGLNNGEAAKPEALQALVDRKLLTPKQVKTYTTAYNHGKFNTDPAEIGQLLTDISNYDPKEDPNQAGKAKLLGRIATGGYPTNVQSEANELLGKKANPKDPLNGAVARDLFQRAEKEFNAGLFLPWAKGSEGIPGTGFLGMFQQQREIPVPRTEEELKNWMVSVPKEMKDAGAVEYAGYLSKMRAYFAANPEASDADAEAYSQQLKRPYILNAVGQALTAQNTAVTPPKPVSTKAEFDALKPGEEFIFAGKRGVKK